MSAGHQPVMRDEVVALLGLPHYARLVDGTVGYGGHAAALLAQVPGLSVLGIDRDADALAAAAERLRPYGDRVRLVRGDFGQLRVHAAQGGWDHVDAVLLDVGVSSPQLDTPQRGFSFRADGPLDMRMDRRQATTASVIVNTWPADELARLFRRYGEEPRSRQVAEAIVVRREQSPFSRTLELAAVIEAVVGRRGQRGLPEATRCFQALRIAVNDELGQLDTALSEAVTLLRPGGRLAVIAFHSLEDRIVKQFLRHEALSCVCPPGCPVCICGKQARVQVLTRKPLRPSMLETGANPRSASARLRAGERTAAP